MMTTFSHAGRAVMTSPDIPLDDEEEEPPPPLVFPLHVEVVRAPLIEVEVVRAPLISVSRGAA